MEKPSYMYSLTSQLVLLVAVPIVIMALWNFFKTGEVVDIFTSLASMVLGAYFQKSRTSETSAESTTTSTTVTASTTNSEPETTLTTV